MEECSGSAIDDIVASDARQCLAVMFVIQSKNATGMVEIDDHASLYELVQIGA